MADPSPYQKLRPKRPEFVLSVWRGPCGVWQCRLKSLRDGTEQLLSDVAELPHFLADWSVSEWAALEVTHAQA